MLAHFSEDSSITHFVPRPSPAAPDALPCVWAIDRWHTPLYLFPRACPRVAFWTLATTNDVDRTCWFGTVAARMVIVVEAAWLARIRATALFRYQMPPVTFAPVFDHGVYTSTRAVTPEHIQPIGDLLDALTLEDVEVRVTPSLVPLAHKLMRTSLHWSLIRMRNARGWAA